MIDSKNYSALKSDIYERISQDKIILEELRMDMKELKSNVCRIQPRNTTSISLVGTDGGNNKLKYDPFLIQIIRVVDSSNNEYYMDVITPTTDINVLDNYINDTSIRKYEAIREMMEYLGVSKLTQLSHMIRPKDGDKPVSASWVQVYRELVEWATLFKIVRKKDFGTDTLIVFDGLLRSKVFSKGLFPRLRLGIEEGIKRNKESNRNVYIVGLAKHSSVLEKYRLAMLIENVLNNKYPCYVEVPREIERKVYAWEEYARGDDSDFGGTEGNEFVAGKMFMVKFGNNTSDPVWPVDIFQSQVSFAQKIIGHLLADSINGFPIPFYPLSLQKAHENAALIDFDFDVIQGIVFEAIRTVLDQQGHKMDIFRLQNSDPASYRY